MQWAIGQRVAYHNFDVKYQGHCCPLNCPRLVVEAAWDTEIRKQSSNMIAVCHHILQRFTKLFAYLGNYQIVIFRFDRNRLRIAHDVYHGLYCCYHHWTLLWPFHSFASCMTLCRYSVIRMWFLFYELFTWSPCFNRHFFNDLISFYSDY